jgi:hypothetical protein
MEKLRNLNWTKEQIKKVGDVWDPDLSQPAIELNKAKWRILRQIRGSTDPLEVWIKVFLEDPHGLRQEVFSLVVLIEDLEWLNDEK